MAQKNRRIVPDPSTKLVCTPLKFRTTTGLQFWYEFESNRIVTTDPDIWINFVGNGGMEPENFIFFQMKNLRMQIGPKEGTRYPFSFYNEPKHGTTWVVGTLGVPLYMSKKGKTYTSRAIAHNSDSFQPVAIDTHFASRRQQDNAIVFITEALAKYNGYSLGACRGQQQDAEVYIRPELAARLEAGDLIR